VSLLLHIAKAFVTALVHPVAGHAGIGHAVHVTSTNLHLNWRAIRPEQRGVQALVAVGLGNGDVILELAGDRLEQGMQRPQGQVGRRDVADNHPKAVDIQYFGKRQVFFQHFAVNAG